MRKALFDTNILLDAAMVERPDHAAALLLLDEMAFGKLDGCIAATSLKDTYFVLTKYFGERNARSYVEATMEAFGLVGVDEAICRHAVASDEPDFEDGIVRACAEAADVDFIISRDSRAFRASPVRRLSAQEYLDLFCNVEDISL